MSFGKTFMILALGGLSLACLAREGGGTPNGGAEFEMRLENARNYAQLALKYLDVGSLNRADAAADPESNAIALLWDADARHRSFAEAAEKMKFRVIYPGNASDYLSVSRDGKPQRVEARSSAGNPTVEIDHDLAGRADVLGLTQLLIHESGHISGYGDEYEQVLRRVPFLVLEQLAGRYKQLKLTGEDGVYASRLVASFVEARFRAQKDRRSWLNLGDMLEIQKTCGMEMLRSLHRLTSPKFAELENQGIDPFLLTENSVGNDWQRGLVLGWQGDLGIRTSMYRPDGSIAVDNENLRDYQLRPGQSLPHLSYTLPLSSSVSEFGTNLPKPSGADPQGQVTDVEVVIPDRGQLPLFLNSSYLTDGALVATPYRVDAGELASCLSGEVQRKLDNLGYAPLPQQRRIFQGKTYPLADVEKAQRTCNEGLAADIARQLFPTAKSIGAFENQINPDQSFKATVIALYAEEELSSYVEVAGWPGHLEIEISHYRNEGERGEGWGTYPRKLTLDDTLPYLQYSVSLKVPEQVIYPERASPARLDHSRIDAKNVRAENVALQRNWRVQGNPLLPFVYEGESETHTFTVNAKGYTACLKDALALPEGHF